MFLQKNLLNYRSKTTIKIFSFITLKSTPRLTWTTDDLGPAADWLIQVGVQGSTDPHTLSRPSSFPLRTPAPPRHLGQVSHQPFRLLSVLCKHTCYHPSSKRRKTQTHTEQDPPLHTHVHSSKYRRVHGAHKTVCAWLPAPPLSLRKGFSYRSGPH